MLSTTKIAPASWATSAIASMSAMPSSGLVGVSTQTIFVRPGTIAARTASTSPMRAIEWSIPWGPATLLK